MKKFAILVDEAELDFARKLVQSELAVTIQSVEIVAGFKRAVLTAQPFDPPAPATPAVDPAPPSG